ncbi:MAG: hypothetical protein WEB53_00880, partial [Akkermansiaceae bacterium]
HFNISVFQHFRYLLPLHPVKRAAYFTGQPFSFPDLCPSLVAAATRSVSLRLKLKFHPSLPPHP